MKEKPDKNDDPDYRILSRYLKIHYAPQLFHTALNHLIERAGIIVPEEKPIEDNISCAKAKKMQKKKPKVEPKITLPPYVPMQRTPMNEYFDNNLGIMIKVYHTAYARLK